MKICFKAFCKNYIPANVAIDLHFLNMIDVAQYVGRGVLPPTPKEIFRYVWEEYYCSLLCDGCPRPTKMSIINFMVYSAGEVLFLDLVNASKKEKNYQYIMEIIEQKIKEIGKHRVVQQRQY